MYKYNSLQAGQLTWEHLSLLQNLMNFIITKYLKQVDDNLSVHMDGCNPCGLSITGDIKKINNVMSFTIPSGEVPYGLLSRSCFYCPNLITVTLLQLEIKRFVTWLWTNDVTTSWGRVLNGTLWMRFPCCSNLTFLASPWLQIYRFSNWSICWLWAISSWYSFG